MCVDVHISLRACGNQRTTCGSPSSLSTVWVPASNQAVRLGRKCPYPWSHFTGLESFFKSTSFYSFLSTISFYVKLYLVCSSCLPHWPLSSWVKSRVIVADMNAGCLALRRNFRDNPERSSEENWEGSAQKANGTKGLGLGAAGRLCLGLHLGWVG